MSNFYIVRHSYILSADKKRKEKRENLKSKVIVAIMLVSMLATILMVQTTFSQIGPEMDILRHEVIKSPDAALIAMQTGVCDFSPDQIRTPDIEKQDEDGMTITEDLGFHMGFIAYNIRDLATIQSYWRPSVTAWPLHDVAFREALITCYDQLGIIPPIYGYIVTPVRSLVPPAQSKYYNPAVPEHPYNPGNPFTSTAGDGTSCGILLAAGYTFVDAGTTGVVDDADYWKCPDNSPVPYMELWTPLIGVAPTSYQHGQEFVADLRSIGLAATAENGNSGFESIGRDFSEYLEDVYDYADFDAYMAFYSLGRLPSQLYTRLHTSQDSLNYPGRGNAPGVNDPTIDVLCETVMYSLDTDAIEVAAKEVQEMLYTDDKVTYPNADNFALSYMMMYSRSYFNAFNPNLRGIVKSLGFGSDNMWTFLNMNWEPGYERLEDGDTVVIWCLAEEPTNFNPTSATSTSEWDIIDKCLDGLTAINPYNHNDIAWIASDWTITETMGGMDIDFTLRNDVEWQDGKPFTAYDVEFCLEFLRDYHVPRYSTTWETLIDVTVTDATHLTISADEAGVALFYEYSNLAPMLPQHIWDRSWPDDQSVLDYDPTEAYNVAPGYTAGPHPPPTNLFGTGPWIFQFYDAVNWYSDLWANRDYFMTQGEISTIKAEMFWEIGDVNRNGVVNQIDLDLVSIHYGCIKGEPCYDPDCDFNQDDIIDTRDVNICAYHLDWYREYPSDVIDVAVLEATTYPTAVPGQQVPISVKAKNKGINDRTVNFTYYYDDTLIGFQTIILPPCQSNVSYIWDTTGILEGTYTIKVNATVLDGTDVDPSDNLLVNGQIELVIPTISVEPQKSIVGSAGKNFSISINITNAPYNNTWAWEFKLGWDVSLLNITDVNEGTFLSQDGTWGTLFVNLTNQEEGWVLASGSLTDDPISQGQPLPHGNGCLATVNFTVLTLENGTLHLSETILLDYNIDPYTHNTQDGEFEVLLGDVNRDGIVDEADKEVIKDAYGSTPGSPNWNPEADIWGPDDEPDGFINVYDLAMWGKIHE